MTTGKNKDSKKTKVSGYKPGKNEEYMSEAQRNHFVAVLQAWKADIYKESQRTREYLKDHHEPIADLNDRASLEEEFALELKTRDRERKLLHKIDKALARIAKNEFGYCERCGEEVGLKRLEARPTAELCIDCKQISERLEKSFHDK